MTVDAIKQQLPSCNEVGLTLDGWTSLNTLAIMLVIVHNIDQNWELHEVRLVFDEVYYLFCSRFES